MKRKKDASTDGYTARVCPTCEREFTFTEPYLCPDCTKEVEKMHKFHDSWLGTIYMWITERWGL